MSDNTVASMSCSAAGRVQECQQILVWTQQVLGKGALEFLPDGGDAGDRPHRVASRTIAYRRGHGRARNDALWARLCAATRAVDLRFEAGPLDIDQCIG